MKTLLYAWVIGGFIHVVVLGVLLVSGYTSKISPKTSPKTSEEIIRSFADRQPEHEVEMSFDVKLVTASNLDVPVDDRMAGGDAIAFETKKQWFWKWADGPYTYLKRTSVKMIPSFFLFAAMTLGVPADAQDVKPVVPVFPTPTTPSKATDKDKEKADKEKADKEKADKEKADKDKTKPVYKDSTVLPSMKASDVPPVVAKPDDDEILPSSFVKNRIESMPNGTKGYVTVDAVRVDSNRRCWLDPDAIFGTQAEGRVVLVQKDDVYGLILDKDTNHQWVAQELPAGVKWVAVKSVKSK